MKKVVVACFVVAIITVAGVGCVVANNPQAPGSYEGITDPARPLTVSPGVKFVVVIASNRTTGFSWQIAEPINEKVVKLLKSEYLSARSDLDGAGGKEVWTFTAVAAGKTTICLHYIRPWEKGKPPEREATYTVIVR